MISAATAALCWLRAVSAAVCCCRHGDYDTGLAKQLSKAQKLFYQFTLSCFAKDH